MWWKRSFLDWRKALIYTHRWMGIFFGLLFTSWFVSGIAFMYWGMPGVSVGERMDRQATIDFSSAAVSPMEAAIRHGIRPAGLELTMRGERPVYRFGTYEVYADNGELMQFSPVGPDEALKIVHRWAPEHALATMRYDRLLLDSDQWTLQNAQRSQMPLHRIALGDSEDTYYYVSQRNGQVAMRTDRMSRFKGFWSGVLHWVYFTPLRKHSYAWNQFIVWGSFAGGLMCLLGLVLGVWRLSTKARFHRKRKPSHSPYSGLMRWHHYSGLLFGLVSFTWVLSGAFSVNPFGMFSGGSGLDVEQREVISGGPFNLEPLSLDSLEAGIAALTEHFHAKEIRVLQFRGELFLTAGRPPSAKNPVPQSGSEERRLLSLSHPERGTFATFDHAVMEDIAHEIMPHVPVHDRTWLHSYDNYYRSRDRTRPLPVLRVRYLDEQRTWLYLDPHSGAVTPQHRADRARRWLYNALHELDLPYLYDRRPLWDIVVILLSAGGLVLAGSTLWPSVKRLVRHVRRWARACS